MEVTTDPHKNFVHIPSRLRLRAWMLEIQRGTQLFA
jgi:hypothetical protein